MLKPIVPVIVLRKTKLQTKEGKTIISWRTFATPAAITPTPTSDTSFTLILDLGLEHFKLKIN